MPSLAEMLAYISQPLGAPVLPILAKSPSNATAGGIPAVPGPRGQPLSSPAEMMNALTATGNSQYENKLREAQAEQQRAMASLFKSAVELGGQGPTYTTGTGGSPAIPPAPPAAPAPAVFGSMSGDAPPSGGRLSLGQMTQLAQNAGFAPDKAAQMAAISMGESGGNPSAYNGKGENSYGITQINADAHGDKAREALNNPQRAMELAFDISKGGTDFSPWSAYKSGDYKKYLPEGVASGGGDYGAVPPVPLASSLAPAAGFSAAPMSLAPGAPPAIPAVPQGSATDLPRLDPASLARAQRMENVYGILGKKMPTWAEEGIKMAPGGSMSPEYKAAMTTTEAWAKVAPELFTQTQLKQVQGGIDLSLKEKQAMLDRATNEQKARLEDALKNRSEGRMFDPTTGETLPVPGYNDVTGATRGAIAGAETAAKTPLEMARDRFKAQLDTVTAANRNIELSPNQRAFINPNRVPFPQVPGVAATGAAETSIPAAPAPSASVGAAGLPAGGETKLEGAPSVPIKFGEDLSQVVTKDFGERRTAALDAGKSLTSAQEARKLLDSGIVTGIGSDFILNLGRALSQAGLSDGETVANTQAFLASRAQEVGRIIKQFGSGTGLSDADREYATKASAGQISLDEKSIRRILDINERASRNVIKQFNADASKVDPNLSPFPLTVPELPEPGRSGVTSGGVRWSRD